MASWEEELARLLRELGVMHEEPRTHPRATHLSGIVKRPVQSADTLFWGGSDKDAIVDGDPTMGELRMMRHRIETIVSQVEHFMQQDNIEASLKEDVLVVLRALRRRAMVTQQAATSDIAYMEFATSMLHFCRLVLRLRNVSSDNG